MKHAIIVNLNHKNYWNDDINEIIDADPGGSQILLRLNWYFEDFKNEVNQLNRTFENWLNESQQIFLIQKLNHSAIFYTETKQLITLIARWRAFSVIS